MRRKTPSVTRDALAVGVSIGSSANPPLTNLWGHYERFRQVNTHPRLRKP